MLNFLEGRQNDYKPRSSIRNKPEIAFGISLQAPSNFQTQYSMFSPSSNLNPFFNIEKNRGRSIPNCRNLQEVPSWIHKTDINQVQEGKVIGSGDLTSRPNRYHEAYKSELSKNSSRFKLTKGQFTNYIEKNHANNQIFGPLVGEERSAEKSLQTKRSIMRRSYLHLEQSKEKLQLEKTLRKQSSRFLEKIIDQRRVVRKERDDFYAHYKYELTERKSPRKDFKLPRVLANRDNKPLQKHLNFGIFKTIDTSTISQLMR